mgnify:CR=1 FL=1
MNKIRKNLGKQETNLSPISTPAITQGYIEGGPQDRKISARAVFFGIIGLAVAEITGFLFLQ